MRCFDIAGKDAIGDIITFIGLVLGVTMLFFHSENAGIKAGVQGVLYGVLGAGGLWLAVTMSSAAVITLGAALAIPVICTLALMCIAVAILDVTISVFDALNVDVDPSYKSGWQPGP